MRAAAGGALLLAALLALSGCGAEVVTSIPTETPDPFRSGTGVTPAATQTPPSLTLTPTPTAPLTSTQTPTVTPTTAPT